MLTVGACERGNGGGSDEPTPSTLSERIDAQNVVLISIDTLRADHLGCYGHRFVKSPTIDALAREGVLFTQHIAAAPTTLASHTSLMTGTYPHTHGVFRNRRRVGDENVMLAEVLKAAGFATAGFVGAAPLGPAVNFPQGFDHYDAVFDHSPSGSSSKRSAERPANEVTDAVLAWLDRREKSGADSGNERERLFLFVHYYDPHWPYKAPPPYERMYRTDSLAADGSMKVIAYVRNVLGRDHRTSKSPPVSGAAGQEPANSSKPADAGSASNLYPKGTYAQLTTVLKAEYGAEITYCDHHLGRLIDGLKRYDLLDSSLIIFTSDHGETLDEHVDLFNHGNSVFDTEIHIPLIMRFPQGLYGGRSVSHLGSNIDVMPTILDLLGLARPEGIEGQSFAGVFDGVNSTRSPVFAEATQPWNPKRSRRKSVWPSNDNFQCVRTLTYKYMFRIPDQQFGFYDLTLDPAEQINLLEGGHDHDRALANDLKKRLTAWRQDIRPIDSATVKSLEHLDALRALGYVGDAPDEEQDTNDGGS